MRLSIDITPEQHQCLKAAAALHGKTIKAYVLERALADIQGTDDSNQSALESLLKSRIEAAGKGSISAKTISDIVDETLQQTEKR